MDNQTIALEPCPFCGGDEVSYGSSSPGIDGSDSTGEVQCHSCDAILWRRTQTEAIAAWNTRTPAPAPASVGDDVVERVARALAQAKGIEICSDARYAQSSFRGPALAALAAMQQHECHAVLRYDRTTPGNENEMPKVLSCNWLPDGEYQVFLGLNHAPVSDDVRSIVQTLCDVITQHHQWHAAQTTPDPEHGYIPSDEYAESVMYERTVDALHKASRLLEPNPNHAAQPQADAAVAVEPVTLNECPPGLFMFNGTLCFKSKYTTTLENPRRYQVDAYCVESGEYFHGGAKSSSERGNLMVEPVDITTIRAGGQP